MPPLLINIILAIPELLQFYKMPKYRIKHITRYSYPSPVIDSANQVMLFPIDDEMQENDTAEVKKEGIPTREPDGYITNFYDNNSSKKIP